MPRIWAFNSSGVGGSHAPTNSFEVVQTDQGTAPTASTPNDILTITGATAFDGVKEIVTIGNATTDTAFWQVRYANPVGFTLNETFGRGNTSAVTSSVNVGISNSIQATASAQPGAVAVGVQNTIINGPFFGNNVIYGYASTLGSGGGFAGLQALFGNGLLNNFFTTGVGLALSNTGLNSFCFGYNVVISADNCIGAGTNNTLTAANCSILGIGNTASHSDVIIIGGSRTSTAANQLLLGGAQNDIYLGRGVSDATSTTLRIGPSDKAGNNLAGTTFQIRGGRGTGTGEGGALALATSPVGSSAALANASVDRLIITGAGIGRWNDVGVTTAHFRFIGSGGTNLIHCSPLNNRVGIGVSGPLHSLHVGRIAQFDQSSFYGYTLIGASIAATNTFNTIGVSTATAITITLPTASTARSSLASWHFVVKDVGGNGAAANITVNRNGANIDGAAANAVINTNYGVLRLFGDGTNWFTW